jgi:hypothetical protein
VNKAVPIEKEKKKRRRELYVALGAAILLAIIFFVESEIARSAEEIPFAGHLLLFGLLSVVTLLLILVIFFLIRNLFKMVFERRQKVLGSKLKTRLTLAFVALTLVPTVVLFIASASVLHTTIESWFAAVLLGGCPGLLSERVRQGGKRGFQVGFADCITVAFGAVSAGRFNGVNEVLEGRLRSQRTAHLFSRYFAPAVCDGRGAKGNIFARSRA